MAGKANGKRQGKEGWAAVAKGIPTAALVEKSFHKL